MNGAASSSSNPSGVQGVCPSGWHLPSDEEWKVLEMYAGMTRSQADGTVFRGNNEGGKLKETGTTYWKSPNTGADDTYDFAVRGAGYRLSDGTYGWIRERGAFFTATQFDAETAYLRDFEYDTQQIFRGNKEKIRGYSVRCIKD